MRRYLIISLILILSAVPLLAEDWLTIYNDDLSLIRSQFELNLKSGFQNYSYDDITSRIMPTSVIVSSTVEGFQVAEQNYEYDLAGKWQIMAKYLDKEVEILTKSEARVVGTLKFFDGNSYGISEKGSGKLIVVSDEKTQMVSLSKLPDNFYVKPTLRWTLKSPQSGKIPVQLTYLSGGFSWDVAYNTVWDGDKLIFNSWVTINNTSGRAFTDVNLKLIAGDINRYYDRYAGGRGKYAFGMVEDAVMMDAMPEFEAKEFHDFHMYTLNQKASFADKQSKQMELFPTKEISAQGIYEYHTWDSGVKSIIRFTNNRESGIGEALPKGVIKVYKQDTDGNLEFIGEDGIDHTARYEEVSINTGKAFDLAGSTMERNRTNLGKNVYERDLQVTLKNNSKEEKTIHVIHRMDGNTRLVQQDYDPVIDSNNKATFTIKIQPDTIITFGFRERTEY